ncbi:MAG: hypothetical protein JWO42_2543 [Chloroflexi bacterium]|nr:hypothetical protein [Chloroflexota bacterium]
MVRVERRRRSRRRRRARLLKRVLLLCILGLIVAGAGIAFSVWPAVQAARDAQTQIKSLEALRPSLENHPSVAALQSADVNVRQLNDDLHTIAGAWRPWKDAALFLSQPLQSTHSTLLQVDPLLAYGNQVSAAGDMMSTALAAVVQDVNGHVSQATLPQLVAHVASSRPALHTASALLRQANLSRQQITVGDLPGTIQHGLAVLDKVLPDAPASIDTLAALPAALGADSPRDYLLVPQNNEDLRATGGFIGTVAVLHVDHGSVRLTRVADSYAVDNGTRPNVLPPMPMAMYGWSSLFFRDGNWSADYPTSAQVLKILYGLGTKMKTDGVIAFTPPMVQQMLQLTGPIDIPGYQERLNASNFFQRLDYQVNVVKRSGEAKAFAVAAYRTVFAHLVALNKLDGRQVLAMLRTSVQSHDLLLYFDDGTVQAAARRAGADGGINPTTGDYVYVVDTNTSLQKVNYLVHNAITYQATIRPDRSIYATLSLRYTNTADSGNVPPMQSPDYDEFVRVLVPAGSKLLSSIGLDAQWATNTVHHKTEFSGHFALPSRSTRTLTFHYHIPASVDAGSAYSLLVQRQPGSGNWPVEILVSGKSPVMLAGQSRLSATLGSDVSMHLAISGGATHTSTPAATKPDLPVEPGSQPEPWLIVPESNTQLSSS